MTARSVSRSDVCGRMPRPNERIVIMMRFTGQFGAFLALTLSVTVSPPAAQSRDGVGILLGRARALEASGRMDLATQNWNQVLLAEPNQPEALAGLARHAKLSGDAQSERMYVDRLRKLDPRNPAIAAIERMRVPSQQERVRLDEAGRLAADRKADQALKIYRDVFGIEPPSGRWAEPFYEVLAASAGGRQEAITRLRALCASDPDNEVYRLWLARVLTYESSTRVEGFRLLESITDSGTVEQARTAWRRALVWDKNNPAVQAPLEAYLQRYPDEENEELSAIVKRFHENRDRAIHNAEKQRGFEALRSGDTRMAQQRFDAALRRSPNDADALAGLGFVRLDQRRFEDALTLFDKARALAPERSEIREGRDTARYWLAMQGGARMKERDPDAAVAAYQAALSIRPREERPLLDLAQLLLHRGDLPAAAARFHMVTTQSPNNVEAIVGLGYVRLREQSFDAAASLFAKARSLAPDRSDIEEAHRSATFWTLMKQADTALTEQRPEDALAGFQRALSLDPINTEALAGLAGAAARLGVYADAAAAYARLIAIDPSHTRAWVGLIRTRMDANDPVAALETTQRLPPTVKEELELRSDYFSLVSLALFTTGRRTESHRTLERAIEMAARADTEEALHLRLQLRESPEGQRRPRTCDRRLQTGCRIAPEQRGRLARAHRRVCSTAGLSPCSCRP